MVMGERKNYKLVGEAEIVGGGTAKTTVPESSFIALPGRGKCRGMRGRLGPVPRKKCHL